MQGKTISGYTLQYPLGMGGMAEVWYAENGIHKPAAVKILNADLAHNEGIVERFRNEAEVMVKLCHPNIRQVYDYGEIEGRPAIIMEYLDGIDLKSRLKQGPGITQQELECWWNQLVEALNYTHTQGIVHRDIKPGNIFVDKQGNIKLLDFGIAKVRESISSTQTGQKLGTLMYMSPEQVKDSKHIDYRTDAYSLAVTFAHLITGKKPYDSDTSSDFEISEQIVYHPLDLSGVPENWRAFLASYLEKDPNKRAALRPFGALSENTGSSGASIPFAENKDSQSPSDDEGTMLGDVTRPMKETHSTNPSRQTTMVSETSHVGTSKTQPKSVEPKPTTASNEKTKKKWWLWVGLAALIFGAIVYIYKREDDERLNSYAAVEEEEDYDRHSKKDAAEEETAEEDVFFENCTTMEDYQAYLDQYPFGKYADMASWRIEEMRSKLLDDQIHSFVLDFVKLTESAYEDEIYELVDELYAPSVKRYYGAYDTNRSFVADDLYNYYSRFEVYGKHSSIRWNTVSYTVSGDVIYLTYIEDFVIDRYDESKNSVFVLEKHFELNKDLQIVSVYDEQLSKSKKQ